MYFILAGSYALPVFTRRVIKLELVIAHDEIFPEDPKNVTPTIAFSHTLLQRPDLNSQVMSEQGWLISGKIITMITHLAAQ